MTDRWTKSVNIAMDRAIALAAKTGGLVGTEHVLYGISSVEDAKAGEILRRLRVTPLEIRNYIRTTGRETSKVVFSPNVKAALDKAVLIANELNSDYVGTEHLLLALLTEQSNVAIRVLKALNIDTDDLRNQLIAFLQRGEDGEELIGAEPPDASVDFFDLINQFFNTARGMQGPSERVTPIKQERAARADESVNSGLPQALQSVGVDLTKKAQEGKLDPVIGRISEIERIIQILCRRTKNNPVLIGEPGVGKSAVVEGLALKIINGEVPEVLKGKRIFALDMASVVAGTKYRGEFEEKLKNALDAIKQSRDIIMFVDEIHTIVNAGSGEGGSLDAANIMKPLLARGEIQTIGATTIDEYRKHIEKDAALERRFQPVMVEQPSVSETIEILKGLRDKYEAHHKVEITDEAISAAAILSDRYITDRFLPDKAIDLIDEAASRKKIYSFTTPDKIKDLEKRINELNIEKSEAIKREQYEKAGKIKAEMDAIKADLDRERSAWKDKCVEARLSIGEEEIGAIVSNWTGIPVSKITEDESQKLLKLEETLSKRIIGQKEAVTAVARAIKRARAGLKDPKRPIGSFIFLGPTGVGKTELSKALAEAMFGDEDMLIRIDMSEYMEKENVSKMIGSAPGYVGYEEGGQLTEKVRRKPYSVVLFDEVEKAHPEVFNVLLQILDDGRLTDSHGRTVNFKNTIIIMTSNIGAREINKTALGFTSGSREDDYERMKSKQMEALKKTLKPEFINRVDDIIIFTRLDRDDLDKVADILIQALKARLKDRNIYIELTPAAKSYLVEKGYDAEYGARPLKRAIQKELEDKLSEEILKGTVSIGDNIIVDAAGDGLTFSKKQEN